MVLGFKKNYLDTRFKNLNMVFRRIYITILMCLFVFVVTQAQFRKIDTTMKAFKGGYKVYCNNKNVEKNNLTITPVNFEAGVREITLEVKGRVSGAEVDDLNNDGFPDLVVYIFTGAGSVFGKVLGIFSAENKSIRPIIFPDIMDDPKLKMGYKGNDTYSLVEGFLMRRFPVYNNSDSVNAIPIRSGMTRQIQYRVIPAENETFKFKVMRTFEFKTSQ